MLISPDYVVETPYYLKTTYFSWPIMIYCRGGLWGVNGPVYPVPLYCNLPLNFPIDITAAGIMRLLAM